MRALGVIGLAAVLGTACGPIEYVNQVTRKADSAVSAAKTAEADRYSPYHYTLAVEYLHKAREEAAAADFQAANRFGRKSQQAADLARQEAVANKGKPIDKFYPGFVPPGQEPAGKPGGGVAPLEEEPVDDTEDPDGDTENPLGGDK